MPAYSLYKISTGQSFPSDTLPTFDGVSNPGVWTLSVGGAQYMLSGNWNDFNLGGGTMPIPFSVTSVQGRIALQRASLLSSVDSYIAALTGESGIETQIWWANSSEFDRLSPTLNACAASLSLTQAQVDSLFIEASQIVS